MLVYVLFHETNSGKFDESDGYVSGVYATEAAANEARLLSLRAAIAEGKSVWTNPDDEEAEGDPNWEDDWRVEAHEVLTEARVHEF